MLDRSEMMTMRNVGVMPCCFVSTLFVMLGCLLMMLRSLLMMFSGLLVVLRTFMFRHTCCSPFESLNTPSATGGRPSSTHNYNHWSKVFPTAWGGAGFASCGQKTPRNAVFYLVLLQIVWTNCLSFDASPVLLSLGSGRGTSRFDTCCNSRPRTEVTRARSRRWWRRKSAQKWGEWQERDK